MLPVFLLTCLFNTWLSSPVKPRLVYLDEELSKSPLVIYARITEYKDGQIFFTPADSSQILHLECNENLLIQGYEPYTTGYWPVPGDEVLIVAGKNGGVSLFAVKQGTDYRFWSPGFTGSVAMFHFLPPARKLPGAEGLASSGKYETCWDGCLLPISELEAYGR